MDSETITDDSKETKDTSIEDQADGNSTDNKCKDVTDAPIVSEDAKKTAVSETDKVKTDLEEHKTTAESKESNMTAQSEKADATDVSEEVKTEEIHQKDNPSAAAVDEYSYTKRDGFTSEIYKLCITNLPRNFGFAEFKKKLTKLELKPVKIKQFKDIVFVTFRCEEDKATALKTLNGYTFRGKQLEAAPAKPAADPLLRKRKQEQSEGNGCEKKSKTDEDDVPPEIRLKNSVTPLWNQSYEDQLKTKQGSMHQVLKKYYKMLEKDCFDLRSWLGERRRRYGLPVELQDIIPSPETEKYRNKCEFTIGPGVDGTSTVVGFRFGTYSQGTICVGPPHDISFVSDAMRAVVKSFQAYLSTSQYCGFNPESHAGNWRQLAVRTSRLGNVMTMIDFHPQSLSEDQIEEEVSKLKEYFQTGPGNTCGITSFFFRSHSEKMTGGVTDSPYRLIFGENHITESLLGMKFRISPDAFFQVNTAAAEVLYQKVAEWAAVTPSSTILDVCCGTGTIGLTVAKNVKKVIGIEMCSQAVEDAKVNAELNDVTNVTYHCAKAEDVMAKITRSLGVQEEVVAIVDPARGGLHSSVVLAIRNCRPIKKLVYVSCNINGALNNMVDLVRPMSKRLKGPRFYPVQAVPVDLFPHTNHCELVILFDRSQETDV